MQVQQARQELTRQFVRSVREGDGWPVEADGDLNDANRALIAAMAEHGECWLGKINLYGDERHGAVPVMWRWDGSLVHNFGCAFAAPRHDEELVRLIRERDDAPYEGARKDLERIEAITKRLEEVGGVHLFWT